VDDIEDKDDNKASIVKIFPTNPVVCDLQSTPWANASVTYVEITDIVKTARIRSHLKKKDLEPLVLHPTPQKALSPYCYLVTFSYLYIIILGIIILAKYRTNLVPRG